MPEGHIIHRTARKHKKYLSGQCLKVTSPQKKFITGARELNRSHCSSVEAYGKHLFYFFGNDKVLHIHLGLFGRIKTQNIPPKTPKGAVRIRLISNTHVVDINGPTICEIQDNKAFSKTINRIGPDLLRTDSDPEKFENRVLKSRRSISALLMDQSVISGIGNIFRTEILWRQKLHPLSKGNRLNSSKIRLLWDDGKRLLSQAAKTGKINTKSISNSKKEDVNIYKRQFCPSCKSCIEIILIEKRSCYYCSKCQRW